MGCGDYSPESCATFYTLWCVIFGVLGVIAGAIIMQQKTNSIEGPNSVDINIKGIGIMYLCFALTYLLAGIFMTYGHKYNAKGVFKAGKVLSYFFPIVNTPAIFPVVIHTVCSIYLCEYVKNRWG
ncbi:uncharacterized protein LOC108112433 isoform X3 [Drosophila eugracilis]|uniref:uncharacterized protein LOC108112433 isoform X3 n=1 Tax=Drosophila eugracilis TaxID=29029 RepID=UPI0007E7C171|nr:uncharacterized protein LOC108112433 isoform X3 [Drosophila eugracilis]